MLNRRLATSLAAVAVAAVVAGGILAARRGPQTELGAAGPLAAAPVFSGPPIVKIDAAKLATGAAPKVTYLRDRIVLGADGTAVQVPGRTEIIGVGRLHDAVLTVQLKSVTSASLVVLDASGKQIGEVAGVDSLVSSADGQAVAYASGGRFAPGSAEGKPGPAVVYYQRSMSEPARQLAQPKAFDLIVLGVTDNTVYFRSGGIEGAWDFYRWQVDEPKPTLIRTEPVSKAALVRCTVSSGACELATPLASGPLLIGS